MIDSSLKLTMLGTDGGIKEIALYLKDAMIERGWKVVSPDVAEDLKKKGINYLPQFDVTINKGKDMDYSRIGSTVESNVLEVDAV